MNIKKSYWIAISVAVATMVIFTGCPTEEEETMSKTERLDQFVSDVNNNSQDIKDNLSDNASNKASADLTFWETQFGQGNSLSYSSLTTSGDDLTATFENTDLAAPTSYTFTMEEESTDFYVIRRVKQGSTTVFD